MVKRSQKITGFNKLLRKIHTVDQQSGEIIDVFDKDALLYQDILRYGLTIGKKTYFKTWDLRKWLLKNNQEYIKLYSGSNSHTRTSIKIENLKKRVEGALQDLVNLELCTCREATAEKSHGPTIECVLSYFGRLVALLFESAKVENTIKKKFVYNQIYDSITLPEQSGAYSSRSRFASLYMKKVKCNGLFHIFVQRYATILFSNMGIANLRQFRQMLLLLPFYKTEVSQLWEIQKKALVQLLNEDEHQFRLFLFNLKLDFERIHGMTCNQDNKYEEMRFRLREDSTVACLEAYCDHCHSFVVGGFNLLLYLNKSIGEQTTKICPCINCGNGYLNIEMDTSVLVNF
jgi:hypothetical protein